jgi:hypothetical protein
MMRPYGLLALALLGCVQEETLPLEVPDDDPCPVLEVLAGELAWEEVKAGESALASVAVRNACEGAIELVVDAYIEDGGEGVFFAIDDSVTLLPGDVGEIEVVFTPTRRGNFDGSLVLQPHDGLAPMVLPMSARGLPGDPDPDPDTDTDTDTDPDTDPDPGRCVPQLDTRFEFTDEVPTDFENLSVNYRLDGCVRLDEGVWEHDVVLFTNNAAGKTDCALRARAVKSAPDSSCDGCDYAFELEWGDSEYLGGGACDFWGFTEDMLEFSLQLGVDTKNFGGPVMMTIGDRGWMPMSTDDATESVLELTPMGDAERTQWWFSQRYEG